MEPTVIRHVRALALCLAALLPVLAAPVRAAIPPVEGRVAVGPVNVRTGNQWADHRKLMAEAVQESLTRLGLFTDVIPQAKLAEKTPAVPSTEEVLTAAGGLGADYLLNTTVKEVIENQQTGQVYVEVGAELTQLKTRDVMGFSLVRGASSQKLGGFRGDKALLVKEAAYNAAEHAVKEIKQALRLTGTVSIANTRDNEVVFITLAEVNTVKQGSSIGIFNELGEKIARLEVGDAGIAQVSGTIKDRKPGAVVRPGMSVRVEYVPSPTFEEFVTMVEKVTPRKKKGGGSLMGILGIGAVAVLLGLGQNKKDAPAQEQAKIVGKVSCSNCTAGSAGASVSIPSSANNVVQPVISQVTSFPPLPNNGFLNQASSVFDFKPDGLQFNTNVTIALGYKDDNKDGCVDGRTDPQDTTTTDGNPVGCVDATKLALYTYDPNRQEWVQVDGTSVVTSGSDTRVTAPVNHFSYYVVLENEAPTPPNPPSSVTVNCSSPDSVKLVWTPSTSTNVTSYNVYECTSLGGGCGSSPVADGIPSNRPEYNVGGLDPGQARFFTVTAVDNNGAESAKSAIAVVAESRCKAVEVPRIITPKDGQTVNTTAPLLVYTGMSDNANGYLVEVYHILTNSQGIPEITTRMFSARIFNSDGGFQSSGTGGGTETSGSTTIPSVVTLSYLYPDTDLQVGSTYQWRVCNLDVSDGCVSENSWATPGRFKILLEPDPPPGDCEIGQPTLLSPANGATFTTAAPTFQWSTSSVEGVTYEAIVRGPSGTIVWSAIVSTNTAVFGAGDSNALLANDTTYSWTVTARSPKGCSSTSTTFFFKKEDPNPETSKPSAPVWAATPITGGNQLVILRWVPNASQENIESYLVYRLAADQNGNVDISEFQDEGATPLAEVLVSQLNNTSINPNCPQSTQQAPVFCDESVSNGTKYYYVIRAKNTADLKSQPSVNVSVQLGLQRPVLVSPGSVLPTEFQVPESGQQISFVLQKVNGATRYVIEVFDETDNQLVKQAESANESFSLTFTVFNQHVYRWQVRAVNNQVSSEVSTPLKFKVVFVIGTPLPQVENLVAVPDSIKREVVLTWDRADDDSVVSYTIQRSESQNPSEFDTVGSLPQSSNASFTFTDTNLTGDRTYYYRVYATTVSGEFGPDPVGGPVKAKLELTAPFYENPPNFSSISDPQPNLAWTPVSGAERYLVQVAKANQEFTSEDNIIWSAVTEETTIEFGDPAFPAPTSELTNNPCQSGCARDAHKWRVGAIGVNTTTAVFRTPNAFYKYLPNPVPVTPLGQGTNVTNLPQFTDATPLLQWKAVVGATRYLVRVCEGSSKCGKGKNILWETSVAGATSVEYNTDDTGQALKNCTIAGNICQDGIGIYTWQVRAVDANGVISDLDWEQDSSVPHNTFIKVTPAPPTLVTPAADEIILPDPNDGCFDPEDPTSCQYNVKFVWGASVGASNYIIRVREEDNEGNFTVIWQTTQGCCTADFAGGPSLRPLKAGTRYTWNVAAVNDQEDAAVEFDPENERGFVTGLHFPTLNTPLANSLAILNDGKLTVNFTWATVPGAVGYDVEITNVTQNVNLTSVNTDPDKKCNPLGAQQIDNYLRVSLPTFICTVATSVVGPFDGDVIRWKIRAVDGLAVPNNTGNPGPWSEIRQFKVGVNGPVLASPPNSAEGVTDPASMQWILYRDTPFYWSPIPDDPAARYLFVVSDDPSFLNVVWVQQGTASPPTSPFNITTGQNATPVITGYTPHIAGLKLPMVNGVTYYWRVAACPSGIASSGDCGDRNSINWIYSPTFRVYKRPQGVTGIGTAVAAADATGQLYDVTLTWEPPEDFNGDVATPESSVPAIPPNGGGYIVSNTCSQVEGGVISSNYILLDKNTNSIPYEYACGATDTFLCVQVVDDSRLVGFVGATSPIITVPFSIPACPQN